MSFDAPDRETCFQRFIALNPVGRAWQTHELIVTADGESVYRKFWHAVAHSWSLLEAAIVNMLLEMFCSTTADDSDLWLLDYDDPCGLADLDLCLKVREFTGGQDIAFYQDIAAALGFVASFDWLKGNNTAYPGVFSTLLVTVDHDLSPAFGEAALGHFVLGVDRFGGSGTEVLQCILERIVPAHIDVIYVVS